MCAWYLVAPWPLLIIMISISVLWRGVNSGATALCVCGGGSGGSWEADRVEVRGERAMKVLAGNTTVCWSTGSPGGVPSWEAWSLRVSMGPREEA